MQVRRIAADDGPRLERVRLAALAESPAAFGSTHAGESQMTAAAWADRAAGGASGRRRAMFFVLVDDEVVGLAGGVRDEPGGATVDLVSMWVVPAARRHGAGRSLVDAVVRWAVDTGAETVALWVTCGNRPAELLYRSLGFVPTGEVQPLPSDPSKDEAEMALALR